MKKYLITNKLYDADLELYIGGKYQDFLKKFPRDDDTEPSDILGEFVYGRNKETKNPIRAIWLSKFELRLLVHEMIHYVTNLMDTKGIKHEPRNDEPIAYLMEFMITECINKLKWKKK